jgi:hypothetical protein
MVFKETLCSRLRKNPEDLNKNLVIDHFFWPSGLQIGTFLMLGVFMLHKKQHNHHYDI